METKKRIVILLILVLLTAVAAQSAKKPATGISGTSKASCLVKVTSDPAVLPVSYETICALLYSSGVGGKAAREILGISPRDVSDIFTIEVLVEAAGDIPPEPSRRQRSTPTRLGDYPYETMMEMDMMNQQNPSTSTGRPRLSSSRTTGARRPSRTTPAISPTPAAEQTFLFQLSVDIGAVTKLPGTKYAAEEFMSALIDNLRSALSDAFSVYRNKLRGQLNLAEEEAARAEHNFIDLQKNLRAISGSRALDRNSILVNISRLRHDLEDAKMNQASNQLYINATTKRIAKIEAKTEDQLKNDAVTKELERILKLELQHLENTKKLVERGRVPPSELSDAEEKLARARIELAQRQEQISKSAGRGLIESLNVELADRSIRTAQHEADLSRLERQIAEAEDLLAKADEYELLSLKADIAKQNLEETLIWRDRMERRNRLVQPPTVTIIGAH